MEDTEKKLTDLHGLLADYFLSQLAGGKATASDVSNMLKFLKDNGVNAASIKNPKLAEMADKLSSSIDDDTLAEIETELFRGAGND